MLCEVIPKSRNAEVLKQLETKVSALEEELSCMIAGTADTLSLYLNTKRSPKEIEERKQELLDDLVRVFKEQNAGYGYMVVQHLLSLERIPDEKLLIHFKEMVNEIPKVDDHEVSFQRRISSILFMASILTRMETQDFERKVTELSLQIAEQKDVLQQANLVLKRSHLQKKIKRNTSVAKRQEQASKESERIVQGQYFLEKWAEIQRLQKEVAHIEELITANERNFSPNMMANEVLPTGQVTSKKQSQALLEQDRLAAELKQ